MADDLPYAERLRRALTRLVELEGDVQHCQDCMPPAEGLEDCHRARWERLMREIRKLLAEAPN